MSVFHKMFMATSGVSVVTPPTSELADPYFDNVELLLHGDGTSGSTTFTDSSPDPKTLTVNGNTQIDTGVKKFGTGSIEFDGTGDYLSSTDTTINSLGSVSGDPFTIEFWLYYTASATFGAGLVTKGTSGTTSAGNNIAIDLTASGYISCTLDGNYSGYEISGNTALSANTWYHVALVKDNSNVFKLFIDGTQETQTYTATGTITASSNCYIGTNQYDPGAATRTLTGYMDDIRITNGVARYTADFNPPSAAHPDRGSDQYFYATELLVSGNGTDGSTTFTDESSNALTITANGNAQVDTAVKKFGTGSIEFDGTGDYLIAGTGTPSYPNFGTGPFTIEMWIYNTASGLQGLWTTHRIGTSGGMHFYIDTNNRLNHGSSGNGDNGNNPTSNNVISLNTWHHVALCREGTGTNQTRIFVDGTEVSSHTDTSNYQTYTYGPHLGSFSPLGTPYYYNGYMDDVRITNVARYTSDFTPPRIEHPDFGATREAVSITASANAQISTAQSKFGGSSGFFDGTGDQLSFTNSGFGTGDFTYEAWIYPNAQVQDFPAFFVVVDDASSSNRITAQYDVDGQANKFRLNVGGTSIYSTAKSTGQWYHVAVVRSGTTVTFYLDGASLGTATYSYNVPSHTGYIAGNTGRSSGLSFKGYIDELRVSTSARYTSGFTPSTSAFDNDSNTLLLLHMDNPNSSTTFIDDNGLLTSTE